MRDPFSILNYRIKIFLIMLGRLNEPRMQLLLHDLVMINFFLNDIVEVRNVDLFNRLLLAGGGIWLLFILALCSFRLCYHCFKIIIGIPFLINLFQQLLILLLLFQDNVVEVATGSLSISSLYEFPSVVQSAN